MDQEVVDLETQRASLSVPANDATDKYPSLSRVSSSKSAASAVTGSSNAVQTETAIMLEMKHACETDLEAQIAPLPRTPDNMRSKSRTMRKLVMILQIINRFRSVGNASIEKSPSLSRVSSESRVTCEIIGSSASEEAAIMLEPKHTCETDLEAQIAPLLRTPYNMRSKSQTMRKLVMIRQIIKRFRSTGNASTEKSPSHSRVSSESRDSYEIIGSSAAEEADTETADTSATTTNLQRANISKIVNEKNLKALSDFGGIIGVADALNTHLDNGITPGDMDQSTKAAPHIQPSPHQYFHFIKKASSNLLIYLLSTAAALSLGFGIKEEGPEDGWSDGAIIVLTIIVHVIFDATRRYRHERARLKSEKQEDQKEKKVQALVIREGQEVFITEQSELVCGDIVLLRKGYQIPADGIFIAGHGLELDDGSKSVGDTDYEKDPFLFHGVKVINGDARMIVTAVGMDTKWSKMMKEGDCSSDEKFRLEANLDKVTTCINNILLLITIIIFIASFVRRFVLGKPDSESGYKSDSKGEPTAIRTVIGTFEKILIEPKGSARGLIALLSVSLVGILDGIPFVISVAIIYWNKDTFKGNGTEQDSKVCLKMASVTAICSDTIGGLTEHEMEVHSLYVGLDVMNVGLEVMNESSMISPDVLQELCDGIGTLALLDESNSSCGMKKPLLSWGEKKLGMRKKICRTDVIKRTGQNPEVECCGELIQINGTKRHLYRKGPVGDILRMCSDYYDSKGKKHPMENQRTLFEKETTKLLEKQMKVIAFASRESTDLQELEEANLTLVGLIGLKSTNRKDTKMAIEACRLARVKTILVSADDVSELEPIAIQCGLLTPNSDGVLKGEDFQKLTPPERMEKLDTIRVLGNSSAEQKQLLVKCLREKGEVVAAIGQRTDDAPAIRGADIGMATGTWSSVSAREVSNITIWEWNFASAVDMIKCGKCIYGNIHKFIQLELIMNSTSILINFIGVISLGDSPTTPIQLFWLNLLVAFPGGLAILTEPPTSNLKSMPPISPSETLVTKAMIRNIVLQTIYQVSIIVVLQHWGPAILGSSHGVGDSMIFNSFVVCQFFNLFNARELQKKNFFAGISRNHSFWIALGAFMACQTIFVVIDQKLMNGASLNWKLWAICFLIGIASWLIDYVGKLVSSFINKDCLTQCMIHLAGKYMSF